MFNVYTHARRLNQTEGSIERRNFLEYRHLKRIRTCSFNIDERNQLAIRYKTRLKKFIMQALEKQPKQYDYYNAQRTEERIGSFRINGNRSEEEKVEQAVREQTMLDLVPLPRRVQFRPRAAEKDIGPAFRFKSKCEAERVFDSVKSRSFSQLGSPLIKKPTKLPRLNVHKAKVSQGLKGLTSKEESKLRLVLNFANSKTFFQGIDACFIQNCCRTREKVESALIAEKREPADYSKLAKKVLQECGVIRAKHYRANSFLKQNKVLGFALRDEANNAKEAASVLPTKRNLVDMKF